MAVYNPPANPFHLDGNTVVCEGDVRHKVSGTVMAGILGCSHWSTPFTVACNLLSLAREDISSKDAVKAGIALETKIIRYADQVYSSYGQFMTEDDVGFGARTGDHDTWVSDFDDEVFAGHVDGIVSKDGEDYILEIKTSANMDAWVDGVPEYYFWQVALYNHFITKQDKAYVVMGIVNETTYRDPASWVPNENNVRLYEVHIDQDMVAETLEKVREWYTIYVLGKVTPEADLDNTKDREMFEHLRNVAENIENVRKTIDEIGQLNAQIEDHDDKICELRAEAQLLKDRLKDYMSANQLNGLNSTSGEYDAKLTTRVTSRIAEERMVADGIDPLKYKVKTESKFISIKKHKGDNRNVQSNSLERIRHDLGI